MEKLKPDATGIYVAAHQAPGAIEEAIEAEVPLVVAVAEHIPIHDMLRVLPKAGFERQSLTSADTFDVENTI
jgi:succinyl-CoA synthetase alpha subunit